MLGAIRDIVPQRIPIRCFSTTVSLPEHQNEQKSETTSFDDAARRLIQNRPTKRRSQALLALKGKTEVKTFDRILSESTERYDLYFTRPGIRWTSMIRTESLRSSGKAFDPRDIKSSFNRVNKFITPLSLFEPLNIGDAVELTASLNQSVLGVVVEVPHRDDDPRYTIMNRLGELTYVERSAIKFRIPGVIPKEWLHKIIHEVIDPPLGHGSIKTTAAGFKTFTVNPVARNVIVNPLIKITNAAWSQIQVTSRKLEIIHRVLQADGPREVSIFSLMKAISYLDVEQMKKQFHDTQIDEAYSKLAELLAKSEDQDVVDLFEPKALGKKYGSLNEDEKFDASTFYSVVLSLRKQSRLWSTSYSSRSTLVPLSITVLPLEYSTNVEYIIDMIKSQPELSKFFQDSVKSIDAIKSLDDDDYDAFFYLLKQFAVGNLNDAKSTTLVSQLLKNYSDKDITRSMVYDFLVKTGHISTVLTNPSHFTTSLNLPHTGVSNKASKEQQYFDKFDVNTIRAGDLATERTDYTDLKVYCIDSDTAHEIDDGVSIRKIDEDNVMLYVHIADPTSYLTHDSTLTQISFERAFTTYQPELISPMFPKSLSDLAGLGVDGRKTRALTFSIPFNRRDNSFNFKYSKVEATYLSKFPKYTYCDVDEVLEKVKDQSALANDEHQDLKDMFEVALKLRDFRINHGAIVFGESFTPQVRVSLAGEESSGVEKEAVETIEDSEVSVNKQETTNSVILVSELMILANRISGSILSKNKDKYSGIFKGMSELPLGGSAATVIKRLNLLSVEKGILPEATELVKAFKFIVPAHYSHEPKDHLMLGVTEYAPATSPLRRFGDVVNHFQFHSILNQQDSVFTKQQVLAIALHIEARNDILKKASRSSVSYYSIKLLEKQLEEGKVGNSEFLVSSRPLNGQTSGILVEFGIYATIKLLANKKPPAIGDVLRNYVIESLNSVEGNVLLKEV